MRIDGEWYLCPDGVERPVIRAEVLAADASWMPARFLLDTGADATVFSAALLAALALARREPAHAVGGVGGVAASVAVDSSIRLTRDDGGKVTVQGEYVAVIELEALDLSVLGRDISAHFAVIVDRPGNTVCMIGQRHRYRIEAS